MRRTAIGLLHCSIVQQFYLQLGLKGGEDGQKKFDPRAGVVHSPYSIGRALSLLLLTLGGESYQQLAFRFFAMKESSVIIQHNLTHQSIAKFQEWDGGFISDATSMFTDMTAMAEEMDGDKSSNFKTLVEFGKFLKDELATSQNQKPLLNDSNFSGEPEAGRNEVNKWIADATKGKIQNFLPPGTVDQLTRMIIVAALHFKAGWKEEFSESPSLGLFTGFVVDKDLSTTLVQEENVRYMQRECASCTYYAQLSSAILHRDYGLTMGGLTVVKIPYQYGTTHLVLFVPDEPADILQLEKFAEDQYWADLESNKEISIFDALVNTTARIMGKTFLKVPFFELPAPAGASGTLQLNTVLQDMGITDVFDAHKADFSGVLGGSKSPNLSASHIFHRSMFKIDEKGSEGVAATAVLISATSLLPEEVVKSIIVDRPFVFQLRAVIKDGVPDAVLFMGRITQITPFNQGEKTNWTI